MAPVSAMVQARAMARIHEGRLKYQMPEAPWDPEEQIRRFEVALQHATREEIAWAVQVISDSRGPHPDHVWEAAALWTGRAEQPTADSDSEVLVADLGALGYRALDKLQWGQEPPTERPQLSLALEGRKAAAHEEHLGHTWYLVSCTLRPWPAGGEEHEEQGAQQLGTDQLAWRVPRRLNQLRECLHDPVKAALGAKYGKLFGQRPFAKHGGIKGTTGRLHAWLARLAEVVNSGELSPDLVGRILVFLRGAPAQAEDALGPASEGTSG